MQTATAAVAATPVASLSYGHSPAPTPLGIAAQLGWIGEEFAADGIAVNVRRHAGGRAVRGEQGHGAGRDVCQGSSTAALWARASGADTRLIGLSWIDESQAVLALPATGVRHGRDLRGRRIGLPARRWEPIDGFRASALRTALSVLELVEVDAAEVAFVDIEVPPVTGAPSLWSDAVFGARAGNRYAAEALALLRGEVDAIVVRGAPGLEMAHRLGALRVADLGFHPDPRLRANNGTPRPLTVDGELLRLRPDLVARLLRRVVAVERWAGRHPARALACIGHDTGAGENWLRLAHGDDLHRQLRTDLAERSLQALQDFADFLAVHQFLPQRVAVADWVDVAPLRAASA